MRSNRIIIMVLSGLKNQSQCWKGLTVPSPNSNVQRKAKCAKPSSCCSPPLWSMVLFTPLKPWSRNRRRIPVRPPSSSKATGKGQSPGHGMPARRARRLGTATKPCSTSVMQRNREPRGESGWGHPVLGAAGAVDPAPRAVWGTGQAKECLASLPGGEERLFILFSVDFRQSLTHFIYRNCFEPLTWATLLLWVKETRIWPRDNFKVLGFMFLASFRYACKCWRILLGFYS